MRAFAFTLAPNAWATTTMTYFKVQFFASFLHGIALLLWHFHFSLILGLLTRQLGLQTRVLAVNSKFMLLQIWIHMQSIEEMQKKTSNDWHKMRCVYNYKLNGNKTAFNFYVFIAVITERFSFDKTFYFVNIWSFLSISLSS